MSEPIYIPSVRAIKGLAPTASQFNQLANNLEYLNTRKYPRACMLKLSADATVTRNATTGFGSFDFDTSVLDTDTLFSGGVLTAPSDASFVRMIVSAQCSTFANRDCAFYPAIYSHPLSANTAAVFYFMAFGIGQGATSDGVQCLQVDTGWVPYDASVTHYEHVIVGLAAGTSPITITSGNSSSWLYLEVV